LQATKKVRYPNDIKQKKGAAEDLHVPDEQVATLAYRLWQERGCPDGSPDIDWFRAERELHQARAK